MNTLTDIELTEKELSELIAQIANIYGIVISVPQSNKEVH